MQEFMTWLSGAFSGLWSQLKDITIKDIADILIVAVIIYYTYKFIKIRRAAKLAIGLMLLLLVFIISDVADMYALKFILSNVFQIGFIAIVILFQPELRSALEKVGAQPLRKLLNLGEQKNSVAITAMISNICEAATDMSATKTGALIVIERMTKLGDIEKTGTVINADVNASLIRNIFYNKAPLHDGAMIISNARISAAGCFLPPTNKQDVSKELGTRHRAAIGMSESSDAIIIVVSEETGTVSIALDGELKRNLDYTALKNQLYSLLITSPSRVKPFKKSEGGESK